MSIANKAYKFRIYPNDAQKQVFEQTFGNIRFIYNKFIFDNKEELQANKKVKVPQPTFYKKDFGFLKSSDSLALANNYLNMKKNMSKSNSKETFVSRQRKLATIHKDFADNKFSEEIYKQKLNNANKFGLLKYKRKSGKQSFTTNNQFPKSNTSSLETVRLENDFLFIPKIKDGIKIIRHRQIKGNYKIKSVTITKSYNTFYEASILIEYKSNVKLIPFHNVVKDKVLGLDFSVPHKYINSLGMKAKSKDYFRIYEDKISALNNKISRNRNLNKKRLGKV